MAAWNGKPVLALTSLGQVPLVPPSPGKAGARAGFLAAFDNSGHSAADEINFAYAKRAASQHDDYDYSHQFLVGLAAGNALLAALSGERADIARARAEEDRIARELAADRAAGIAGDADEDFEFYPTPAGTEAAVSPLSRTPLAVAFGAEPMAMRHAAPPIGSGSAPRCGTAGTTVLFASDVTCPQCRSLMAEQARDAGEPHFFGAAVEDFRTTEPTPSTGDTDEP